MCHYCWLVNCTWKPYRFLPRDSRHGAWPCYARRQWKASRTTPIPKIALPSSCQDYRPISITPILSRLIERELVRSFLYLILVSPEYSHSFCDQFAFRQSGSTSATLVYLLLMHQITSLLQHNEYVHIIAPDFTKAFGTVGHHTLISKMSTYTVPDCFRNWLVAYLSSRIHQTTI